MKKLLILAAMAGVALVSCVKNEPAPSVTDQQEITFAPPVVGVTTKVDLPTVYPNTESFGVFAYHYASDYTTFNEGALYMNDVLVAPEEYEVTENAVKSTHSWLTPATEKYYWPKTGSLTFAAYSPASINDTDPKIASYTTNGIQFTGYTVALAANQDLMFSDRTYNAKDSDQNINNDRYYGVDIKFNHALSAILFQVKAESKLVTNLKYEFYVQKIEVLNAFSKGNFNQGLTDDTPKVENTPTVGTDFINDWTSQSEPLGYVAYEAATDAYGKYEATAGIYVNSASAVSAYDSDPTDGTDGNIGKADLILLPQALTHGDVEVQVKVTYKLRHAKMATNVWIENNVVTANLTTVGVPEWFRGKRYIYTLTIDLDEIYLSPEVVDWTDETVTDEVTVDNQVTNP